MAQTDHIPSVAPKGGNTMAELINGLVSLHHSFFAWLTRVTEGWFTGFAARFVFASLFPLYYWQSAVNKLGDGFFGFLSPSLGAYATIIPPVMEQYGFDPSAIPFFPWHIIVYLGTWTEFILPALVVIGLFSRIASIGMIGFIFVQSYVDIKYLGLEEKFVGSMFDRFPDAIIWDQRLLWVFLLVMIIIHGPGKISLDHLLGRKR